MPIEIRELHIRVAVEARPEPQRPGQSPRAGDAEREAMIAECVEQVLRILRSRKER